jgi:hypothetical protein
LREQRFGLTAKVIEVGTGRKFLFHGSSMHRLGSAIRLHEGRARKGT